MYISNIHQDVIRSELTVATVFIDKSKQIWFAKCSICFKTFPKLLKSWKITVKEEKQKKKMISCPQRTQLESQHHHPQFCIEHCCLNRVSSGIIHTIFRQLHGRKLTEDSRGVNCCFFVSIWFQSQKNVRVTHTIYATTKLINFFIKLWETLLWGFAPHYHWCYITAVNLYSNPPITCLKNASEESINPRHSRHDSSVEARECEYAFSIHLCFVVWN